MAQLHPAVSQFDDSSYQQKPICSHGNGEEAPQKSCSKAVPKFQLEQFTQNNHPQPCSIPYLASISKHTLGNCTPVPNLSKPNHCQEHKALNWNITSRSVSAVKLTPICKDETKYNALNITCCEFRHKLISMLRFWRDNPQKNLFREGSEFWLKLLFSLNSKVLGLLLC